MKPRVRVLISSVALVATCVAKGAVVDKPETWEDGGGTGWECYDWVNERSVDRLSETGGALVVSFPAQQMRTPPEEYMLKAGGGASGGVFAGDYVAAGVATVSFRIHCDLPMEISLLLGSAGSGHVWRCRLDPGPAGAWRTVRVPVNIGDLKAVNAVELPGTFADDLRRIEWIGVSVERNDSPVAQKCTIDDVRLTGPGTGFADWIARYGAPVGMDLPSADADGDGHCNWREWIAATSPVDKEDVLSLGIQRQRDVGGTGWKSKLRWDSREGRRYNVWYAEDAVGPFARQGAEVEGDGREKVVERESGGPQGFYRLSVRRAGE
jgi:hypothetical protein